MPANFTSGWLGNGERAWHGLGTVTEGTLPAREAFEKAEALFTVEKRELFYSTSLDPQYGINDVQQPSGIFGVVRTDTQALLGDVSKQYEIVQNDSLLRMAEFIREEVDMDSVVVLADGAKVCFTATLKGAAKDIVPGDTVKRRIVGYLGHDGKTGCGAMFTTVRVVCTNTLADAMRKAKLHTTIRHMNGANDNFNALIKSIDCARETFGAECELMQEFAKHQMYGPDFRDFVSEVYDQDIEDLEAGKFRKYRKLRTAFRFGLGAQHASGSLWNAVNAVTEIETSTKTGTLKQRQAKFKSANFGTGLDISRKAMTVAKQLVTA